jgi:hypothetical protein
MKGTEVGKVSWFRERVRELLVSVHNLGFEHTVRTYHRVGYVIVVDPGHRCTNGHSQRARAKAKVINFHFGVCRGCLLRIHFPALDRGA